MFSRRPRHSESFSSRYGAGKATKTKRSFKETSITTGLQRSESMTSPSSKSPTSPTVGSPTTLTSAIITVCVGPEQRLFAGHEDMLSRSTYFASLLKSQFYESPNPGGRRINLPDESPEVLSAVLEYLYKGDYYPKLLHSKRKDTWEIEGNSDAEATVFHHAVRQLLLKDTAVYCAAEMYALPDLSRLALRKQGLRSGVQISTILASARWAYAHTPDHDSRLRAHYLALIIRSRGTFKKSTTMQAEMDKGGRLFFDLFVAMCNHIDDLSTVRSPFSR